MFSLSHPYTICNPVSHTPKQSAIQTFNSSCSYAICDPCIQLVIGLHNLHSRLSNCYRVTCNPQSRHSAHPGLMQSIVQTFSLSQSHIILCNLQSRHSSCQTFSLSQSHIVLCNPQSRHSGCQTFSLSQSHIVLCNPQSRHSACQTFSLSQSHIVLCNP